MSPLGDDFVWGVSTSAFQIEGAVSEGGRGESIWDRFARSRGRIADGSDGSVATDHYHRWQEDLDLTAGLGVGAYRFSVSWPRVQPDGRGRTARAGIDFYDRLVDGLLDRGVAPWACLYHWDLPQSLEDRGGWTNRDMAAYFADYVELILDIFGDRVSHLFMLNEPNVHAVMGHLLGLHAPGRSDLAEFLAAVHHQNLATGLGIGRARALVPATKLGTILNLQPVLPGAAGEEHEAAAALVDAAYNRAFLDPLLRGSYPEALIGMLGPYLRGDDLAQIAAPLDILGVNHYTRLRVLADPDGPAGLALAPAPTGSEVTDMGWEIAPNALHSLLLELRDDYGNPAVVITENGAAFADRHDRRGRVDDRLRGEYLVRYVRAVERAVEDGCDVRGYFVWTLVDNFEWAEGFSKRFGLVQFDRETLARTPKSSYELYRRIVAHNGVPGDL